MLSSLTPSISVNTVILQVAVRFDPSVVDAVDSSTLISNGVFSYSVLGENSVALVSLADNQVLLSGDVIIPAEVQINGKTYYVESVYCSLSDIVDSAVQRYYTYPQGIYHCHILTLI